MGSRSLLSGLTLATFCYDHFVAQTPAPGSGGDIHVTVDVTNTGSREGHEMAQLYVREDVSRVETPRRSLAGFSRIHRKPGETRTVSFRISQSQLASWTVEGKWAVEPGHYTLWAGGSSQALLTTGFQLKP